MRASLTSFESGWCSLSLELSSQEIEPLIEALRALKASGGHFHFRSSFEGDPGVGDIEFSCSGNEHVQDLELDATPPAGSGEPGT